MFKTITDAKNYYLNCGRFNMEKLDSFNETALIEDLFRIADTEEQAEAILALHIPNHRLLFPKE